MLDLREVGLHRYARHPSTAPWCLSFAIGDNEPVLWTPEEGTPPRRLPMFFEIHVKNGEQVIAHNAPFELEIWNQICVPRYGWPPLAPEQTFCTMAQSYAMGLPGALEDAALALGLHVLKDTEGRALMLRMARPRKVVDGVPTWWDDEEKLKRLYAYCQQDVRVERELHKRLMPLSARERKVWLMDYAINQRGVRVDIPTAQAAVAMAATMAERHNAKLSEITGGAVQTVNALIPFKAWLAAQNFPCDSLAKQEVVDLLAATDPPPLVRQALALRQEAGKASTAKLTPMLNIAGDDGRIRHIFQYHGAAPGRWAGRKVQPHNFPRDMFDEDTAKNEAIVEKIFALVRAGDVDAIDMMYGPPMSVLSKALKAFLIPGEGMQFCAGDFSSVEGRGVAWFAGEQWKVKAYVAADNGTGPEVYRLGAGRILGIPPEQVTKTQRQSHGKVPELALGYQGGVGAFQTMAKTYGVKIDDEEADRIKDAWRDQHPAVAGVRTRGVRENGEVYEYRKGGVWKQLQAAAIDAVLNPGETYQAGHPSRSAKFKMVGSFLWCLLPSGRALCYPYPKILPGEYGPQLTYMAVPSVDDKKKGKIIDDPKNASNWARVGTYGGSLLENIVQAFCRDLLVDVMLRLHDAGAAIVLHVHDEVVIETLRAKAVGAAAAMQQIMRSPPAWAAGFPLYAECGVLNRYGK